MPDTPTPDPRLREFLADADEPCPECGYNLRDLTGGSCPECGEALVLQIGRAEPRMRAFINGIIALACGTGFFGLLLAWVVVLMLFGNGGPTMGDFFLIFGLLVISGAALFIWTRGGVRRRLRRGSLGAQWMWVMGCWLLTLALSSCFFIFVSA